MKMDGLMITRSLDGALGVDDSLFVQHGLEARLDGWSIGVQICITGSCNSGLKDTG